MVDLEVDLEVSWDINWGRTSIELGGRLIGKSSVEKTPVVYLSSRMTQVTSK